MAYENKLSKTELQFIYLFILCFSFSCSAELIDIKESPEQISGKTKLAIIDPAIIKSVFKIEGWLNHDLILDVLADNIGNLRGYTIILERLSRIKPPIEIRFDANAKCSYFGYDPKGSGGKVIILNKFEDIKEEVIHAYYAFKLDSLNGNTPHHRSLNAELDAKLYDYILTHFNGDVITALGQYPSATGLLIKYGYTDFALNHGPNSLQKFYLLDDHYRQIFEAFKKDVDDMFDSPYYAFAGNGYYTAGLDIIISLLNSY